LRAFALVLVAVLFTATTAMGADPAEGKWAAGRFVIRLEPCAKSPAQLCGLVAAAPPGRDGKPPVDSANPDPALRTRPILGLALLHGFHLDGTGRWSGGKIYDPRSGKTFDSTLAVTAAGALSVAGCVLVLCKTQTWTRVP
jgi:uncharacterized protein (DUF2147 family)